jgi:hypothetical protein
VNHASNNTISSEMAARIHHSSDFVSGIGMTWADVVVCAVVTE